MEHIPFFLLMAFLAHLAFKPSDLEKALAEKIKNLNSEEMKNLIQSLNKDDTAN